MQRVVQVDYFSIASLQMPWERFGSVRSVLGIGVSTGSRRPSPRGREDGLPDRSSFIVAGR